MGVVKSNSSKDLARVLQQNKRRFYKKIWKKLFIKKGGHRNITYKILIRFLCPLSLNERRN